MNYDFVRGKFARRGHHPKSLILFRYGDSHTGQSTTFRPPNEKEITMLHRLSAAAFGCALSLALAGCQSTGTTPTIMNPVVLPAAVQADTVKICGYVPSVVSTAEIIATYSGSDTAAGIVELASNIANDICASVVPAKASRLKGARVPVLHGVRIVGRFVR